MSTNRPNIAVYEKIGDSFNQIFTVASDERVDAGKESTPITVYVGNITKHELVDLSIFADDKDLVITPSRIASLMPSEKKPITLIWKPKITRETGLLAKISGIATKVVKPR